jgi:hypothetical protein
MAGSAVDLLSSAILGARAKKTQQDKDWPMIRRLLEADFFNNRDDLPDPASLLFWLRELRTPEWLVALCNDFRELAIGEQGLRPFLGMALDGRVDAVKEALFLEEREERRRDREYWAPFQT